MRTFYICSTSQCEWFKAWCTSNRYSRASTCPNTRSRCWLGLCGIDACVQIQWTATHTNCGWAHQHRIRGIVHIDIETVLLQTACGCVAVFDHPSTCSKRWYEPVAQDQFGILHFGIISIVVVFDDWVYRTITIFGLYSVFLNKVIQLHGIPVDTHWVGARYFDGWLRDDLDQYWITG